MASIRGIDETRRKSEDAFSWRMGASLPRSLVSAGVNRSFGGIKSEECRHYYNRYELGTQISPLGRTGYF